MASPYANHSEHQWREITEKLIAQHPLSEEDIVSAVLEAWDGIMKTRIADELQIGVDIFPTPQVLGNFLHELIPVVLEKRYPGLWSRDVYKKDKDLVCLQNPYYSCEIKTSSNRNNIYGNASYGQEDSSSCSVKSRDGYYIAVNFEKFDPYNPDFKPHIRKIRFGWLDHTDWHSQHKASGQQSSIRPIVRDNKLKLIYDAKQDGRLYAYSSKLGNS